jgi:hypothetical protein
VAIYSLMTDMSYKYTNYFASLFKRLYLILATPHFECKNDRIIPIPKFFMILRNTGSVLLAIRGTVVEAPVVLPAMVVSVAGAMVLGRGILSAVSQMTVSPFVSKGDSKGEEEILRQAQDDNNKPRDGD